MEIPIDLSRYYLSRRQNTTQTITGPLLDRMELIEVNSYTENENITLQKTI
ncbi:MAG: hypothetical protein ACLR8P_11625 [Clostridium fessum]